MSSINLRIGSVTMRLVIFMPSHFLLLTALDYDNENDDDDDADDVVDLG